MKTVVETAVETVVKTAIKTVKSNHSLKRVVFIAAIVAVVMLALWVGAAWYSGKQIQQRIDQQLIEITHKLNQDSSDPTVFLSYRDYQRSVFSSQLLIVAERRDVDGRIVPLISSWVKLYHGPLPLDRLAQFNLMPQQLSSNIKLIDEQGNKSGLPSNIANIQIDVNYASESKVQMTILPLTLGAEDGTHYLSLSAATLSLQFNKQLALIDISGQIEQLHFYTDKTRLTINGLQLSNAKNLMIHQLDYIRGAIDPIDSAQLTGLTATGGADSSSEFSRITLNNINVLNNRPLLDTTWDTHWLIEGIHIAGNDLGNIEFDFLVDSINRQTLQKLINYHNAFNSRDESPLSQFIFLQTLNTLLNDLSRIAICNLVWQKDQQQSQFSLDLTLQPIPVESLNRSSSALFSAVKSYRSELRLSLPMLKELISQQIKADPALSESQAQRKIDLQLATLLELSRLYFALIDEAYLTSEILYGSQGIRVNGQTMSNAAFYHWLGIAED